MSDPLVSIGVAVSGPMAHVERAVRSALGQSYESIEIILYHGPADQDRVAFVDKFADSDTRVKVFRETRKVGAIECFTASRAAASGEYFMWLDETSWIDPGYVATGVEYLIHNAHHVLVHGTCIRHDHKGAQSEWPPTAVTFEDPARRVEAFVGNVNGHDAWYGLHRLSALSTAPVHPALGFEYGWLTSVAWRGKIAAQPDMTLYRDGPADDTDASNRVIRLGLGNFQATDPWLTVAALQFCNLAFFDEALAHLPPIERARLGTVVADAVSQRQRILDEGMMISFAARLFPSEPILEQFRALRTTLADAVLALRAVSSTDPFVQNLIGTINVLCRMRIGNIPMTKEDKDIVRQIEVMWDSDQATVSQNKVAIVSAMYL